MLELSIKHSELALVTVVTKMGVLCLRRWNASISHLVSIPYRRTTSIGPWEPSGATLGCHWYQVILKCSFTLPRTFMVV